MKNLFSYFLENKLIKLQDVFTKPVLACFCLASVMLSMKKSLHISSVALEKQLISKLS